MRSCRKEALWLACLCVVFAWGCRKNSDTNSEAASKPVDEFSGAAELVFSDSLRVADESVNIFVRTALTQCAGGNYEAFRALWSAKRDPVSRSEFEEGWHAVHRIEVRGLRKAMIEADPKGDPETVYVLLVEVSLDPQARAGRRTPLREIVLMLVQEHDQWRLAAAPKDMREWIKKHASTPSP